MSIGKRNKSKNFSNAPKIWLNRSALLYHPGSCGDMFSSPPYTDLFGGNFFESWFPFGNFLGSSGLLFIASLSLLQYG